MKYTDLDKQVDVSDDLWATYMASSYQLDCDLIFEHFLATYGFKLSGDLKSNKS